jgi:hypothetical protein
MNSPYVSSTDLNSIGIYEGEAGYKSGFGVLGGGTVFLGNNNRYFPDLEVMKLIKLSILYLCRRYYKKASSTT